MRRRFPTSRVRLPHVGAGQSVGLYGGSFDPVHDGHRLVAERAFTALRLDWVWWMVTPGNPLKDHDPAHGLEARIEAVRQHARHPRRKVLSVEADLGVRYTADTVSMLTTMQPDVRFVWLMGADNLASFNHWKAWRTIAETVPIAIIDRPGARHASLSSPFAQTYRHQRLDSEDAALIADMRAPAWTFVRGPLSPVSSTELRQARHSVINPTR